MSTWEISETQQLEVDEPVRMLHAKLVGGHIDVVASDSPTTVVEVSKVRDDPIIVTVEHGVLTISHRKYAGGTVKGWLYGGGFGDRSAVVSVAVPAACAAEIDVVSAGAVVAGLDGNVRVRCVSGDVTLDGASGDVNIGSVSGDVEGRGLAGEMTVKTVSGSITVVDSATKRLRAKGVSGDVALDLHSTGRIEIDVSTVSGDLTVRMPETTGTTVDVSSASGRLTSAFDGLSTTSKPGRRAMSGSIGDGAGSIRGRTVSGSVALLVRYG
ncbi:MAG TPA: DUF4097 family beta strand repeat-containing protein [Mycobacteriales bacterium]|jgi:hypothetical protein|nr:DUF4097 family beta strand repeat-containing protein [Mycobacteriales bacterium]